MPFRPPDPDWAAQFVRAIRQLDRTLDDETARAVATRAWPSTLLLTPAQAAVQVLAARRGQPSPPDSPMR